MTDQEIQKYYEFYTLTWKLLRRGLREMTTTSDPVKLADDMRSDAAVIFEQYKDLDRDSILTIITKTLKLFYVAYESLPRPERDPEQMTLFDVTKGAI